MAQDEWIECEDYSYYYSFSPKYPGQCLVYAMTYQRQYAVQ